MTFEQALDRLDEIAGLLDSGNNELDMAVELYAEAAKLIAYCNKKLGTAQAKIEKVAPAMLSGSESCQETGEE